VSFGGKTTSIQEDEEMAYDIKEIQGIGPSYAEKLAAAKIGTTDDLLTRCCDPKGRKSVAAVTGVDETHLLKWANMADMMRVSGIGGQYSELLEASGVDTVKELATRNAESLATKMKEINDQKNLANATPSTSQVEKWVSQAKSLDPKISY
jgi:predicted flap endonuclease-1-like 5' DNA nuclease